MRKVIKIMSDVRKVIKNNDGQTNKSSKEDWMWEQTIKIMSDILLKAPKEATRSNDTHICKLSRVPAWEAWKGYEGTGAKITPMEPNIINSTGSIWGVSKSNREMFDQKIFVSIFRIMLLTAAGKPFSEISY